jgi:hypothetical protein
MAGKAALPGDGTLASANVIEINSLDSEVIQVPIIGTSPLIIHRFSEKAKQTMLDAMQNRKSAKVTKDPAAEYEACFYRFADGGYGFPSLGFKAATTGAARYYRSVTMVALRLAFFFQGERGIDNIPLFRIEGTPKMREDVVRVGQGSTDLRYRPEFEEWNSVLTVRYIKSLLTRDSVLALIHAGGQGLGVGEWRPERNGEMGTYTLDETREIRVIQ